MSEPKPILDSDQIIKRLDDSNTYLANASDAELVVAGVSTGKPLNGKVKFDGATERYGINAHTSEHIKERIASCREAYEHCGLIGNAIDLMVDFALEGFDIVHPSPAVQNFYRAWARRVDLQNLCSNILKCFFRDGNVPVLSFRARIKAREYDKLQKVIASKVDGTNNIFVDEEDISTKVIPYAYHVLDVMSLEKDGSELLDNVRYRYQITSEDLNPIRSPRTTKDQEAVALLKKAIGDGDFDYLKDSGYLRISPGRLSMLYYKKDDYRAWANPMFWRVMSDVRFKSLLRDMDVSVVESVTNTLTIIALGDTSAGFPADPKMFAKLASLLKTPTKSKTIIWNDLIKIIAEYPPVEKILGKEKYEQVNGDIREGIGISEVVLNGQGGNYSNSFISVKTLMERLEYGRNILLGWLDNEVNNIAKAMRFKQPAWFKMHHMSLRDEDAEKKMLLELVDRGMISYETCVDRFGENFNIEVERMKREDDFRRKNEKKYPYTIVKTGKFGPMMTEGPTPVFELLDNETVEELKLKRGTKEMPSQQGGQGQKGGRPTGTSKPQQKKTAPRNSPVGQSKASEEVAKSIFDKVLNIIGYSLEKSSNKKIADLSNESKIKMFGTIARIIGGFSTYEDVNKNLIQNLLKVKNVTEENGNQYTVMTIYNNLMESYFSKHGSYPSSEEIGQIIVLALSSVLE